MTDRLRHLALVSVLAAGLCAPRTLRADTPPPEARTCVGKDAGEACSTPARETGACAWVEREKPDYRRGLGNVRFRQLVCVGASAPPMASSTLAAPATSAERATATPSCARGCSTANDAGGSRRFAIVLVAGALLVRRRRPRRGAV